VEEEFSELRSLSAGVIHLGFSPQAKVSAGWVIPPSCCFSFPGLLVGIPGPTSFCCPYSPEECVTEGFSKISAARQRGCSLIGMILFTLGYGWGIGVARVCGPRPSFTRREP
jgi:hypothetical protein